MSGFTASCGTDERVGASSGMTSGLLAQNSSSHASRLYSTAYATHVPHDTNLYSSDGTFRRRFGLQASVKEIMELFPQPDRCVAAAACRHPYASNRRHFAQWVLRCTLPVLGAIAVGPLHAGTISPQRLLEVTDLGNPAISPDGRYVAFRSERASVERNTYDTVWYVQDLDGKSPARRVADGGIPLREYATGLALPAPATWSPDGRWIYYRALIDGKVAVWRAAADGSGAMAVTSDPADVRGFMLSADGETLMYRVGATREEVIDAEQAEYDRGIRIDETVPIGAGLFRSSDLEGRLTTRRFLGDWFSSGPLLAKTVDHWSAIDTKSLEARELNPLEVRSLSSESVDLSRNFPRALKVAVNPSDRRVALIVDVPGQERGAGSGATEILVLPDKHSAARVKCSDERCMTNPATMIQWRPGSDDLLFTVRDYHEGRAQSVFLWNVSTGAVRLVVHSGGLMSGGRRYWDVPCGLSYQTLVCVSAEADKPPRLVAIDLETGHRRILFDPNRALAADIAALAPARLIRWKDTHGREYTGQFFGARRTPGSGEPPLFVTLYTCDGFLRGGLGDEWPLASLAEQGISALCINGLPMEFADRTDTFDEGPLSVAGIAKRLSSEGAIDPTRIGMGGLSYGGEIALWTLMHSRLLAAASLASPATPPTYYLANSLREAFREGLKENWGLGSPDETPDRWRVISPTFDLDKVQAPVLFQLAEQEYVTTLDYTVPLVLTHRADMYVFPNEPHVKFQPKHKLAVYERNVDWFRFWLQGYEDPDPGKTGQYEIWRRMRQSLSDGKPH